MIKPKTTDDKIRIVLINPSTPNDKRIKMVEITKPELRITL